MSYHCQHCGQRYVGSYRASHLSVFCVTCSKSLLHQWVSGTLDAFCCMIAQCSASLPVLKLSRWYRLMNKVFKGEAVIR